MESKSIALLNNATKMLAEVQSIDDAKNLMDTASAAKHYARKHGLGVEAVTFARSIEIASEIKLGEFLQLMEKNKGGPANAVNHADSIQPPTYVEIGISRNLASEAQVLAILPESDQNDVISGKTSKEAAKKKHRQKEKEAGKAAEIKAAEIKPLLYKTDGFLFDPGPVDLLLTDPPYSTDIDDIKAFAPKVLDLLKYVKQTGRAYIFIGSYPEELAAYLNVPIAGYMKLNQILVWTYRNTLGPSPKNIYKNNWQAILYFTGIDAPPLNCPVLNELFSVQDINAPDGRLGNRYHVWQKPIEIADRFIRHATNAGGIVYDPFAGTGTFLISAAALGRKAIGCEIDQTAISIAESRGIKWMIL